MAGTTVAGTMGASGLVAADMGSPGSTGCPAAGTLVGPTAPLAGTAGEQYDMEIIR